MFMYEALLNNIRNIPQWTIQERANTVTAITAIVGAAFVVFQIIQIKRNPRNSTHERITNESFQILKFLSDAQGTYEYFYSSKEPPKELDEKLKYATEMVSNYLEHVLLQKKYLPRAVRGNWHSYVKEICKTAPIVREHVERYKTQYSKTLRRVIDKVEKEIKNRPIEG
jgi:hypothetical protein